MISRRRLVLCERAFFAGTPGIADLVKAPCDRRARFAVTLTTDANPMHGEPDAVVCGTHRRTLIRALWVPRREWRNEKVTAGPFTGGLVVEVVPIPGA